MLIVEQQVLLNFLPSISKDQNTDENSVILLRSSIQNVNNEDFHYLRVSAKSSKFYRPVIYIKNNCFDNITLSNVNQYNLNECSLSAIFKKYQTITVHEENKTFTPKYANNVKLALIESYNKTETLTIDSCLKEFFQISRYLHYGDIISITINRYAPETIYNENKNTNEYLYFKVEEIEGELYNYYEDNVKYGYLVNREYTTVHQVQSVQCYIPSIETKYSNLSSECILNCMYSVIPDGLDDSHQIEEVILPFLRIKPVEIKLCPVFLISGKSGSGKRTLLHSVAIKCGIHYYSENCVLIQNNNPAQTETVISNIFSNIESLSPCIFHFRNIEALCEEESGNKDDRTINNFIKHVKSVKSKYPVIIYCSTTDESKIIPSLYRIFLEVIMMKKLEYTSRRNLLNWILKEQCLATDCIDEIAHSTINYVFADLIQLISRTVLINAQKKQISQLWENNTNQFLSREDFLRAIDEMNSSYADSIGAPEVPNVTWDDIGGLSHLKEEILTSLMTSNLPNTFRRSGILLYGPPGTGKTLLAKAIATDCKFNFLSVKGPELLNMYVGQSEKNVREVFSRARNSAPCIVFFDELDSLAPKRGQSGGSGSVMDRVVSQLLAEMDGIQKSTGVFVLATTNRPDLIDSALLRPGRLDKMLYIGNCKTKETKLMVLKALTRKFKFSNDVCIDNLVSLFPESYAVTGADLYGICADAWLNAARRKINSSILNKNINKNEPVIVSNSDMEDAINRFKF